MDAGTKTSPPSGPNAGVGTDPSPVDGRSERWREHRQRRREQFIDAAFQALAEHGPDVRMEQIAAAAGAAKPKLYRHFATKADLVDAVAERSIETVIGALAGRLDLDASVRVAITSSLDGYLQFVEENPNVVRFLMENSQDRESSNVLLDQARSVARLFVAIASADLDGIHVPAVEIEPLAHALVGAVLGATDWWMMDENGSRLPRARLANQLTVVLTSAAEGALNDWGVVLDMDRPGLLAALGAFVPAAETGSRSSH